MQKNLFVNSIKLLLKKRKSMFLRKQLIPKWNRTTWISNRCPQGDMGRHKANRTSQKQCKNSWHCGTCRWIFNPIIGGGVERRRYVYRDTGTFRVTSCELLHGVLKGGSMKGMTFERDSISRCGFLKSLHVLTDDWRNTVNVKEDYCFSWSYSL